MLSAAGSTACCYTQQIFLLDLPKWAHVGENEMGRKKENGGNQTTKETQRKVITKNESINKLTKINRKQIIHQ